MPNEAKTADEVVFDREVEFQRWWLENHSGSLEQWLYGRTFLFCPGNHDFIDPVPLMKEFGINAIDLNQQRVEHAGLSFYGLPFVPYLQGRWNFELETPEMQEAVAKIPEMDILVAHCPPAGILDWVPPSSFALEQRAGNSSLFNWMKWGNGTTFNLHRMLLCGHHHSSYGIFNWNGLIISNAATRVHTFEIEV
jgi:Icc-related predicted phosphoesterase